MERLTKKRNYAFIMLVTALLFAAGWERVGGSAWAGVDNGVGMQVEQAGPPAPPNVENLREAHLLFIGDVMIGRHVGELMRLGGADAPFANVKGFLSAPDLTIANLECPTVPTDKFRLPPKGHTTLNLTADAKLVPAIKRAGIDVVSLANNHAYDAGGPGLQATVEQLRATGLVPIGLDKGGTQDPYLTDIRGIRIAFLAYADFLNIPGTGISYIRQNIEADRARVTREVGRARKMADVVVVFWHWGPEYAIQPSAGQRSLAQLTVDAGADLVVGAHPHVSQGMEVKEKGGRNVLVAYSLGNALFDQYFSLEVRQGLALDVRVDKAGVKSARLVPLENRLVTSGYTMNVAEDQAGQTAIARAARSTSDDLEWKTLWSAGQAQPAQGIAYRRPYSAGGRVSLEELGLGADTRVSLGGGTISLDKLTAVTLPTPTRVPATTSRASPQQRMEWKIVWSSERGWRVTGYSVGDVDADGQRDLVYTLWKRQLVWSRPPGGGMEVQMEGGDLLPHIYVNTWRGGGFAPLWHGSPRPAPLLSVAVAPIANGGKTVLAALESADSRVERAPGTLRLWQWSGSFGFELVTTVKGTYREVWSDGKVLMFR